MDKSAEYISYLNSFQDYCQSQPAALSVGVKSAAPSYPTRLSAFMEDFPGLQIMMRIAW